MTKKDPSSNKFGAALTIRILSKISFSTSSLVFSVLLFLFHIFMYLHCNNANWIGAFGALLTVLSVLAAFRYSAFPQFLEDMKPPVRSDSNGNWLDYGTGGMANVSSEAEANIKNPEHFRKVNEKYKPVACASILAIFGTLIWAYAFLLPSN